MMELTAERVARVAALARIRVTAEELPAIEKDLSGIFHWIDQLESVDVKGVKEKTL
jgi:aspartyl-tRNA(Asn)/glutamyl-tRNA(Gln) amidotransferase subunit C